ncbi:beta/gamma crystallin domain-containing protein [Streptomyces sp. 769]|uniref:beta/gamma crystallin domain-containing protein n=1 Tax=Streptomyces sp. 769 TaxID=1262452 RepID=UPI001EEFAC2B|nr:beta/gamma crystallin domain-containing protein [Streptomyces sp. 769]
MTATPQASTPAPPLPPWPLFPLTLAPPFPPCPADRVTPRHRRTTAASRDTHVERTKHPNERPIWKFGSDGRDSVDCYANRGRTDFDEWWVDRISTGDNDLIYYDENGDSVKIERWHDITFPNRPPKVSAIEIL